MISFNTLTKAQRSVMSELCKSDLPADIINPSTLGALCIKGLANVSDGVVMGKGLMRYTMWQAGLQHTGTMMVGRGKVVAMSKPIKTPAYNLRYKLPGTDKF